MVTYLDGRVKLLPGWRVITYNGAWRLARSGMMGKGGPMRRHVMRILLLLAALSGSAALSGAQHGSTAQRLVAVGGFGGAARAMATFEGGILLGEGAAVLRLDAAGQVQGQLLLDHGEVQDLAVQGGMAYALTEEGLATVDLESMAERAFSPGGGQALAVAGRAVYVAAQQAGLRVAALGPDGIPGGWRRVETPGAAGDLAVGGAYLYAALGERGIGIYDLAVPLYPVPVGWIDDVGAVSAVAIDPDAAGASRLLAGSGHRLRVFDLSDPAVPRLLDTYDPLHEAQAVFVQRGWAYVADAEGGLKRYAIGDLDTPRIDGVVWPGAAHDLAYDGLFLYVAAGWDGVVALETGWNDSVATRGRLAAPGEATSVAVERSGGQCRGLVGLGAEGVAVVDWCDFGAPRLLTTLPLGGAVWDVALRGTIGFAAVEGVGVAVFSLARPAAPRLLATVAVEGTARSLALEGSLLYVAAGEGGLYIVETVHPDAPLILGRLPPPRPDLRFEQVTLEGGKRAYISAGSALLVVDVDVAANPQVLAIVPVPAAAIMARDFIAYVVSGGALTTINAASSNAPEVLGAYRAVRTIQAVAAQEGRIWLAGAGEGALAAGLALDSGGGLREQAMIGGRGEGRALDWLEGAAVLATASGTLYRLDENGAARLRQGSVMGQVLRPAAEEGLLVGGTGWGLLDLSRPERPILSAAGDTAGPVYGLAGGEGGRVFLAQGEQGVTAVGGGDDRWLPGASDGIARDVATDGAFLFVAEDGPGEQGALRVLSAETLASVTRVTLPGGGQVVAWDAGRAYVGLARQDMGGLAVVDVSAPTAGLATVGTAEIPAHALALTPDERIGYAAHGAQLVVLDLQAWPELRVVTVLGLPQPVTRLSLAGTRWLLATAPGESVLLLALDDPLHPRLVATLPVGAFDAVGTDEALYLAAGEDGLQVISLATLAELTGRMERVDSSQAMALWRTGSTLYVADAVGLRAYSLDDPTAPQRSAAVAFEGVRSVQDMVGRATRRDGQWLYVATDAGLLVARHGPEGGLTLRSGPEALPLVDVWAATDRRLYGRAMEDTLVVVALGGSTAQGWSLSYPLPATVGAPQVALAWGDRVLVGGEGGLAALVWSEGMARRPPALLGEAGDLPGVPRAIQVAGDGSVWLAGEGGLWRVDVSEPTTPTLQDVLAVPGTPYGMALSADGARLAVASGACGVRLLSLADGPPREIGYWQGEEALSVAAVGDLYAVTNSDSIIFLREAPDLPPVPPAVPFAPQPSDGAWQVGQRAALSWSPPPDPCAGIRYTVLMGVGDAPLEPVAVTDAPHAELAGLPRAATIRWQVQVRDAQGDAASGPVWRFATGEATPSAPQRISLDEGRVVAPTPAAAPPTEAVEPSPGLDARALIPLLLCGVLVEALLVLSLWQWRRRFRRWG